jgi:hypothetical protein
MNDYDRYQEIAMVMPELVRNKKWDEFQTVWKEMEQIKNRHGGMPPKKPE